VFTSTEFRENVLGVIINQEQKVFVAQRVYPEFVLLSQHQKP
jgi:hypothetical protein